MSLFPGVVGPLERQHRLQNTRRRRIFPELSNKANGLALSAFRRTHSLPPITAVIHPDRPISRWVSLMLSAPFVADGGMAVASTSSQSLERALPAGT